MPHARKYFFSGFGFALVTVSIRSASASLGAINTLPASTVCFLYFFSCEKVKAFWARPWMIYTFFQFSGTTPNKVLDTISLGYLLLLLVLMHVFTVSLKKLMLKCCRHSFISILHVFLIGNAAPARIDCEAFLLEIISTSTTSDTSSGFPFHAYIDVSHCPFEALS